jgi:dienelactone hydrolase
MRLWLSLLLIALAASTSARAVEQIQIPDEGISLRAALYRPQGDGPFPAIVGLHGCSGLAGRGNPVGPQYQDWAERLVSLGYAVLLPDSFGSRGLGNQCRSSREGRVRPRVERVRDANAARLWLQAQTWVRGDKISLIGWSHGAAAVLWTVRPQALRREGGADFRSAIAFYPSCRRAMLSAWSARLPTLILGGSADDWMPAKLCQTMADEARGRSARVEVVIFPGAHHRFDHPSLPLRERTDLALSASGSGRAHEGSEPRARAEAIRKVTEWLAKYDAGDQVPNRFP